MPQWGWDQWSDKWLNRYNIPFQLPRRLVAAGDCVYVTLGYNAPLSAIDGATGKVIRTYEDAGFVDEILHIENRLVLSTYTTIAKPGQRSEPVIKSVCSVDPETGKVLWKTGEYKGVKSMLRWINPFTRLELCTTNGRVFLIDDDRFVALDLKTGNEIWTAPRPDKDKYLNPAVGNDMCTLVCYEDVVIFAQLDPVNSNVHHFVPGSIYSFSAKDGKMLWEKDNFGGEVYHSQPSIFVIDDLVWYHEHQWPDGVVGRKSRFVDPADYDYKVFGADPVTGKIMRTINTKDIFNVGHHHRCHRNFATENYILVGRRGVELIDVKTGDIEVNDWVRGTCLYGYLPCNGMIYTPPHPCQCYQNVLLTGFNAMEPFTPGGNDLKRIPDDQRLQKGPAYGKTKSSISSASENDWPAYRHDGERTASSKTNVNPKLKEVWQIQLKGKLTAPVTSGGKVFVASKDENKLYALNAENGKEIWVCTTDGIVDSPPTIYDGLVFCGTRNGWLYALDETNGKLLWRFLAAAEQRLIGVYGRLESAWPVFGSPLINNGKLYCTAGRTSYLDGGIDAYELDPHTGRMLASKHYYDIDPETGKSPDTNAQITPGVRNDILVACEDSVFLNHKRIVGQEKGIWEKAKPKKEKPVEGKITKPVSRKSSLAYKGPTPDIHMIASGTFLDDSYFTRTAMSVGTSYGQLIAYNEKTAYGLQVYESAGRNSHFYPGTGSVRLYSSAIAATKNPWAPDIYTSVGRGRFETNWSISIPVRAKAMVLANETIFLCGQPDSYDPKDPFAAIDGKMGSVIMAVSAINGEILAEHKIESIPVFDSLIAANNSLYLATEDGKLHCYK